MQTFQDQHYLPSSLLITQLIPYSLTNARNNQSNYSPKTVNEKLLVFYEFRYKIFSFV